MKLTVEIEEFNGPFDLLLHLIKKENINIVDISILKITEQYLEYINKYKDNLDITSEYLVIASELIELKSKILLPNKDIEVIEEIEEAKQDLVNRLKEYEKYKEITNDFKNLEIQRKEYYIKEPTYNELNISIKPKLDDDITLQDLTNAFTKYLQRLELEKPVTTKVTNKEYSVELRSIEIKNILKNKKQVKFIDLFNEYNRSYIVVTFLSILQMAKNNELIINQTNNFEEIYIEEV